MYFRDPKKELPNSDVKLFVKAEGMYLPMTYSKDKNFFIEFTPSFTSAVCHWGVDEIEGWMPLSELDSIGIK